MYSRTPMAHAESLERFPISNAGLSVSASSGVYPKRGEQNRVFRLPSNAYELIRWCELLITRIDAAYEADSIPVTRPDSITVTVYKNKREYKITTFRTRIGWSDWAITKTGMLHE